MYGIYKIMKTDLHMVLEIHKLSQKGQRNNLRGHDC